MKKRNGKSAYSWPDGRMYIGEWKNDLQHGQGILTHPTGEKYVGQWKDDFIEEWG